jgi:hypothetical protein
MEEIVYVCCHYNNILGVCSNEERAKEICSQDADFYVPIEIDKYYGRDEQEASEFATYSVNGEFVKGRSNIQEKLKEQVLLQEEEK